MAECWSPQDLWIPISNRCVWLSSPADPPLIWQHYGLLVYLLSMCMTLWWPWFCLNIVIKSASLLFSSGSLLFSSYSRSSLHQGWPWNWKRTSGGHTNFFQGRRWWWHGRRQELSLWYIPKEPGNYPVFRSRWIIFVYTFVYILYSFYFNEHI